MKGVLYLMGLRIKQGLRGLASVGWLLLLIGLPMIAVLLLGIFEASEKGWIISFLYIAIVAGLHLSRKDKFHLINIGLNHRLVFFAEYLSLAVLLGGINYLLVGNCQNLLLMLAFSIVLTFIPQSNWSRVRAFFFFPVGWIPKQSFEWRSGFRVYGWWIIFVVLMGFSFASYSPAVTLVALIFLNIGSAGWYKDFETSALFVKMSSPGKFLRKKIYYQLLLSSIVYLPLYVIFLFHFADLWYLLLAIIILGHFLNCFAIFYKYAGFHPSRRKISSDLAVAIFSLSTFVPFLAPITIVYIFIYFKRAYNNVEFLYADC